MLEECSLPYNVIPMNINKGDPSTPEYEAINPNNKMPAIVDHDPLTQQGPGDPLTICESGAILQYLGEKTGQLLPAPTDKPAT
jgi:GST-like protein